MVQLETTLCCCARGIFLEVSEAKINLSFPSSTHGTADKNLRHSPANRSQAHRLCKT